MVLLEMFSFWLVNLYGAADTTVSTTALGTTEASTSLTDAPTTNGTEEPRTEEPHTNATTILPETPNTTGNTTEAGGLSGGAIAGITIGSIAGVGLVGE